MSKRSFIRKANKLRRDKSVRWWRGQALLKFQKWLRQQQAAKP